MPEQLPPLDAENNLNVLQIVALDVCATLAVFATALLAGATWPAALLLAWAGGVGLTLGVAGIICHRSQNKSENRTELRSRVYSPPLVPRNIADPFQLWETDRLMELDHDALTHVGAGKFEAGQTQPVPRAKDTENVQEIKRRASR